MGLMALGQLATRCSLIAFATAIGEILVDWIGG